MVVDLPAPLGPRKPVTRPGSARKVMSSTATKSRYLLVSACVSIMGSRLSALAPTAHRGRDPLATLRGAWGNPGARTPRSPEWSPGVHPGPGGRPSPRAVRRCAGAASHPWVARRRGPGGRGRRDRRVGRRQRLAGPEAGPVGVPVRDAVGHPGGGPDLAVVRAGPQPDAQRRAAAPRPAPGLRAGSTAPGRLPADLREPRTCAAGRSTARSTGWRPAGSPTAPADGASQVQNLVVVYERGHAEQALAELEAAAPRCTRPVRPSAREQPDTLALRVRRTGPARTVVVTSSSSDAATCWCCCRSTAGRATSPSTWPAGWATASRPSCPDRGRPGQPISETRRRPGTSQST